MENGRQLDSRLNQEKGIQQENMRLHVCWPALGLLDSTVLFFVGRPFEKILLHHPLVTLASLFRFRLAIYVVPFYPETEIMVNMLFICLICALLIVGFMRDGIDQEGEI
jgi:hypothetical protein